MKERNKQFPFTTFYCLIASVLFILGVDLNIVSAESDSEISTSFSLIIENAYFYKAGLISMLLAVLNVINGLVNKISVYVLFIIYFIKQKIIGGEYEDE